MNRHLWFVLLCAGVAAMLAGPAMAEESKEKAPEPTQREKALEGQVRELKAQLEKMKEAMEKVGKPDAKPEAKREGDRERREAMPPRDGDRREARDGDRREGPRPEARDGDIAQRMRERRLAEERDLGRPGGKGPEARPEAPRGEWDGFRPETRDGFRTQGPQGGMMPFGGMGQRGFGQGMQGRFGGPQGGLGRGMQGRFGQPGGMMPFGGMGQRGFGQGMQGRFGGGEAQAKQLLEEAKGLIERAERLLGDGRQATPRMGEGMRDGRFGGQLRDRMSGRDVMREGTRGGFGRDGGRDGMRGGFGRDGMRDGGRDGMRDGRSGPPGQMKDKRDGDRGPRGRFGHGGPMWD